MELASTEICKIAHIDTFLDHTAAVAVRASGDLVSTLCPHCGATNVFRGFTVIEAFVAGTAAGALMSSGLFSDAVLESGLRLPGAA
jgi:hypothetical protein